jgi:hypothetical protein
MVGVQPKRPSVPVYHSFRRKLILIIEWPFITGKAILVDGSCQSVLLFLSAPSGTQESPTLLLSVDSKLPSSSTTCALFANIAMP